MTEPIVPAEPVQTPPANEPVKPVTPETVEKQKYDSAIREMNLKQQEAALLRKEIDLLKKQQSMPPQPAQPTGQFNYTEEQKQNIMKSYGKDNWGDVQLILDAAELTSGKALRDMQAKLDELSGTMYEGQYQATKDRMKKDDPVFQRFEPEIEARVMQLSPRERLNPAKIKEIRRDVIDEHFEEILQMTREEAVRSLKPTPASMPSVNDVGGSGDPSPSRPVGLTAQQRKIAEQMGQNPEDVENFISGKKAPSMWDKHLA